MNKIIYVVFFIIAAIATQSAMANGYCDSRRTADARRDCYNALNQANGQRAYGAKLKAEIEWHAKTHQALLASSLPQKEKDRYLQWKKKELDYLPIRCNNDTLCIYTKLKAFNDALVKRYGS